MLDHASTLDVLGLAIGKLDPVVKQVVGDPEYELVDTFAALLAVGADHRFLSGNENAAC